MKRPDAPDRFNQALLSSAPVITRAVRAAVGRIGPVEDLVVLFDTDEGGGNVYHRGLMLKWVGEVLGADMARLVAVDLDKPAAPGRYRVVATGKGQVPEMRVVKLEDHRA